MRERTKFMHVEVTVPLTLKNLSSMGTAMGKQAGWDKAGGIMLPLGKQHAMSEESAIFVPFPKRKQNYELSIFCK